MTSRTASSARVVVTNRVDWLSELDLSYRGQFGARVTGAGTTTPTTITRCTPPPSAALTSYNNSEYSSTVKRYVNVRPASCSDALWANMIGAVPPNVIGRHTKSGVKAC